MCHVHVPSGYHIVSYHLVEVGKERKRREVRCHQHQLHQHVYHINIVDVTSSERMNEWSNIPFPLQLFWNAVSICSLCRSQKRPVAFFVCSSSLFAPPHWHWHCHCHCSYCVLTPFVHRPSFLNFCPSSFLPSLKPSCAMYLCIYTHIDHIITERNSTTR